MDLKLFRSIPTLMIR